LWLICATVATYVLPTVYLVSLFVSGGRTPVRRGIGNHRDHTALRQGPGRRRRHRSRL